MISVTEAIEKAAERRAVNGNVSTASNTELTDEESMRFDAIDVTVEAGIMNGFTGDMFEFRLPVVCFDQEFGTPAIVNALKQRYEEGGWSVAVFPRIVDDQVVEWQIVFAPTSKVVVPTVDKPKPKVLPSLYTRAEGMSGLQGITHSLDVTFHRILLRMPTRMRAAQAIDVLTAYRRLAGAPFTMEVVVDPDDKDTLRPEVLQRLCALDCIVTVDEHESKIAACNGGRVNEWDILVLASDDMMPVVDGWAVRVIEEMEKHWPHLDGALHFNDGFQRSNLCTLPVMGRRLYDQFGYVYSPDYTSLFCDREYTDLLRDMGRLTYIDEKIIEHRHHAWGRAQKDALYDHNDSFESHDKTVFERRRATKLGFSQFRFESPPMWLSVLICTVPNRRAQLDQLLEALWWQVNGVHSACRSELEDPREVEILVDNREGVTVGEKRQALLKRAKGHYVAFIDDDDMVAHDYLHRVVGALKMEPEADCTSLVGAITTDGLNPQKFEHSIRYDKWETVNGVHRRYPNHLNAIRRELALEVGFLSKNVGEDFDFSTRLQPFIKTEADTGDEPLYYYFFNNKNSVQSKP